MSATSVLSVTFVFFFQAEDGIRDLVRSRGLGDVYKRQAHTVGDALDDFLDRHAVGFFHVAAEFADFSQQFPVSYTHLTLPTSDLV